MKYIISYATDHTQYGLESGIVFVDGVFKFKKKLHAICITHLKKMYPDVGFEVDSSVNSLIAHWSVQDGSTDEGYIAIDVVYDFHLV